MTAERPKKPPIVCAAVWSGTVGPIAFGAVLTALTALQYEFMLGIGWRPLAEPGDGWPSGLALGPYGSIMDVGFVLSGALLCVFAVGLHRGMGEGSKAGPALLFVAGVAMSLLAFETDPIRRTGPRSWHGLIHDAVFVVFAAAMLLGLLFLWHRTRADTIWRRYTLATPLGCAACLTLPGVAYYLFVAGALAWIPATALKLRRDGYPAASGANTSAKMRRSE